MRTGYVGSAPSLPFQGSVSLSRHCSSEGAKAAQMRAGSQAWRVYLQIQQRPLTYHELAAATDLPLATICARVGWLRSKGLVQAVGTKPGPCKTRNTLWGIA